ncbi:hypothetical protein COT65_00795 [Candidatus Shapirobacteria bacterium CG09_land_8_20_14_0_10_47_13]|uniref:Uncharacterized protein n=1 Tax=Candidatus Shapirobacteria bacterium CG09_land_8_20_14_0_10_47_13 TaxID=1974481 RepID=A0A2H0WNA1_9BACT|nr:MAG: hypothetical protein COT65_00795 [Candidatus Shapirobacteria bacterium CG09_land_8_20_14_0_10_47_13]
MPKRKDRADWAADTPAGLPHGSVLLREACRTLRKQKGLLEGKGQPDEDDKSSVVEAPRVANPRQKYLVGGKIIAGRDFPEGILPANARLMTPAPWKHLIEPRVGDWARFGQTPQGKER